MGSRRRSVFERLGPPADAPPAPRPPAEEPVEAHPLKQRVALAHPLVARHLMLARPQQRGAGDSSQPAPQEQAIEQQQQRKQQPRQRRQPELKRGSPASTPEAQHQRQQLERSRSGPGGVKQELQRLKAERDAAEEMLGQMAAQTQSLLADKAALQQQAAKLEALACALQERLDYLLLEDDSQEWYASEGLLPDEAAESEQGGSYGSSAAQPSTPSATYAVQDVVAAALHGRLDGLAAERQQQLCDAAVVGTPSSSGSAPSSSSSPQQPAPAADVE